MAKICFFFICLLCCLNTLPLPLIQSHISNLFLVQHNVMYSTEQGKHKADHKTDPIYAVTYGQWERNMGGFLKDVKDKNPNS